MVVDASALLSVLFEEKHGLWAAEQINAHAGELIMSTVNLTECLILINDRQPKLAPSLEKRLLSSPIEWIAPDLDQARIAARARARFPLNLGDCFAYALAASRAEAVLTTDSDFRALDIEVIRPD